MSTKKDNEVQWLSSEVLPKIRGQLSGRHGGNPSETTLQVKGIDINFISIDESFMLTICYRATVAYESNGVAGECNLMVKKTPCIPRETYDAINFSDLFTNEIISYEFIIPAIERFSHSVLNVPAYYHSQMQSHFAAIVLGDFRSQGYRMSSKRTDLSLEHALIAVKYLAKFHGMGFALRHKHRAEFDSLAGKQREARFANNNQHPEWQLTREQSKERLLLATRKHQPRVKEEFMRRLHAMIVDDYRYRKGRVAPVEPMITLCHGDYLRNNIAFKYDNENSDIPVDAMMFDLQTMRVSSPMIDLSVFLAVSTFAKIRWTHFEEIFTLYSNELNATYVSLTGDPTAPAFLHRESLLREYISFLPYSIGVSASFVMSLVEPVMDYETLLVQKRSRQEIIDDTMRRGGEEVDREIAHQAMEMYELSQRYAVDLFHSATSEN